MSQTIVPTGPPPAPAPDQSAPVPASGVLAARLGAGSSALRAQFQGSPGRLRGLAVVSVLAALLIGFGGGFALRERSAALDQASGASAHLVLVQGIQTGLMQADADATNAFLTYGLEPAAKRADFLAKTAQAEQDLIRAETGAGDTAALATVNADLAEYQRLVSGSRANNLQGVPIASSYLTAASRLMREDIVPALIKLTDADRKDVDAAYGRAARSSWWLALVVIVGGGALIWAQVRLARQTHRRLNLPLAAGSAALLAVVLLAAVVLAGAQSKANDVRSGALTDVRHLSESRTAAFGAKSAESLGIINRGSLVPADVEITKSLAGATGILPDSGAAAALAALQAYTAKHAAIVKLDQDGDWQGARKATIATGSGSANASFDAYAIASADQLTARSVVVSADLRSAGRLLLPVGILTVLVGLLAAIAAWFGISLRLDEYR